MTQSVTILDSSVAHNGFNQGTNTQLKEVGIGTNAELFDLDDTTREVIFPPGSIDANKLSDLFEEMTEVLES